MRPDDTAPDHLPAHALESLRVISAQHSRVPDDAEDLLQDALLEAVRAGRADLSQAVNFRWVAGVVRNLAAMTARTAVRRRIRESTWSRDGDAQITAKTDAVSQATGTAPVAWKQHPAVVALPPSLRAVALLALAGHDRAEIAWLLRLTPTAMRQRIAALRQRLTHTDAKIDAALHADRDELLAHGGRTDLPLGLIRRALLPVVVATNSAGVHDPDGHLITVTHARAHVLALGGNSQAHDCLSKPLRPESNA